MAANYEELIDPNISNKDNVKVLFNHLFTKVTELEEVRVNKEHFLQSASIPKKEGPFRWEEAEALKDYRDQITLFDTTIKGINVEIDKLGNLIGSLLPIEGEFVEAETEKGLFYIKFAKGYRILSEDEFGQDNFKRNDSSYWD